MPVCTFFKHHLFSPQKNTFDGFDVLYSRCTNGKIDYRKFLGEMPPVMNIILPVMWPTCLLLKHMKGKATFTVSPS